MIFLPTTQLTTQVRKQILQVLNTIIKHSPFMHPLSLQCESPGPSHLLSSTPIIIFPSTILLFSVPIDTRLWSIDPTFHSSNLQYANISTSFRWPSFKITYVRPLRRLITFPQALACCIFTSPTTTVNFGLTTSFASNTLPNRFYWPLEHCTYICTVWYAEIDVSSSGDPWPRQEGPSSCEQLNWKTVTPA